MAYGESLRKQVLHVQEKESLSQDETALRFDISQARVSRWKSNPQSRLGQNRSAYKIKDEALLADVEAYPDAYQSERASRLGVSQRGVSHALKRLKLSRKKNTDSS